MVKFAGMTRTPGDNIWEISWSNNAQNNVKNNNSDPSLRCYYNWRIHAGGLLDATRNSKGISELTLISAARLIR